jgi:EAL domain-containing protein (putative c-di-GMP-specific phosphodiesterase class I)
MAQEFTLHRGQVPECGACRNAEGRNFNLTMAFQPIVDVKRRSVFAYEALVRGQDGASAMQVLRGVTEENLYAFDQHCRVTAIALAARLDLARHGAKLSVNFMPGAVYSPSACIRRTLQAAREHNFPLDAIIFEITEGERVQDTGHLRRIAEEYQKHGFTLALDDFGAGFSGLNLLAEIEGVQLVKLDGNLVRNIHENRRAEHIVSAVTKMCQDLEIMVLAECVETLEEYQVLRRCGIYLMQGYLFARPAFEALPEVTWPGDLTARHDAMYPSLATAGMGAQSG